jgi:surface antigen Omp85-like protein
VTIRRRSANGKDRGIRCSLCCSWPAAAELRTRANPARQDLPVRQEPGTSRRGVALSLPAPAARCHVYGGGTRDVRGWGAQLLGPKLPQVELQSDTGVSRLVAERYAPLGGLARMQLSTEVHLPLPGLNDAWQGYVFLDGARVWTPDRRFSRRRRRSGAGSFLLGHRRGPGVSDGSRGNSGAGGLQAQSVRTGRARPTAGAGHFHFSIGATF